MSLATRLENAKRDVNLIVTHLVPTHAPLRKVTDPSTRREQAGFWKVGGAAWWSRKAYRCAIAATA